MPWNETCAMDERDAFMRIYLRGDVSMTELCDDFNVSRKTGYKWLERYRREGLAGLADRRSTPLHCPTRLANEVVQRCVRLKREKRHWGPKKLIALGESRYPALYWPAASTVGEHLKRLGLVKPRRKRNLSVPAYQGKFTEVTQPNDVWFADFKGQFRTGDKKYCYPLTATDADSRFLMCCSALPDVSSENAKPVFEQLFHTYGLPLAIRTDNGPPFASIKMGFSRLSLWWIKLGILHERIEPGHPEQNGQHERMHRTLKAETTRPPKHDLKAQQKRFDQWREEFNQERPHESLGQTPPANRYVRSDRSMPDCLPEREYPKEFEVRRVRQAGEILWRNRLLYLSTVLMGELIGLQRIDVDRWQIWFGNLKVAVLDERLKKVLPMSPV